MCETIGFQGSRDLRGGPGVSFHVAGEETEALQVGATCPVRGRASRKSEWAPCADRDDADRGRDRGRQTPPPRLANPTPRHAPQTAENSSHSVCGLEGVSLSSAPMDRQGWEA